MKNPAFLILGGDTRQQYLAEHLKANHYDVKLFGFTENEGKEYIKGEKELKTAMREAAVKVFPLPMSKDGETLNAPLSDTKHTLSSILGELNRADTVFGGMIPGEIRVGLLRRGIYCSDYYESEHLQILNAVLTAEGIVKILIEALPVSVHGLDCAVTGFGRTAKATASALRALGANVTVFARSETNLAEAQAMALNARGLDALSRESFCFDAVINTVPATVLGEKQLDNLDKDTLIIEVASSPFGVNFEYAGNRGIRVIKAPSLPGAVSPKTAGEIICDTILRTIRSEHLW